MFYKKLIDLNTDNLHTLREHIAALEKIKHPKYDKEITYKWVLRYNYLGYRGTRLDTKVFTTIKKAQQYEKQLNSLEIFVSLCKRKFVRYVPKWVMEE